MSNFIHGYGNWSTESLPHHHGDGRHGRRILKHVVGVSGESFGLAPLGLKGGDETLSSV